MFQSMKHEIELLNENPAFRVPSSAAHHHSRVGSSLMEERQSVSQAQEQSRPSSESLGVLDGSRDVVGRSSISPAPHRRRRARLPEHSLADTRVAKRRRRDRQPENSNNSYARAQLRVTPVTAPTTTSDAPPQPSSLPSSQTPWTQFNPALHSTEGPPIPAAAVTTAISPRTPQFGPSVQDGTSSITSSSSGELRPAGDPGYGGPRLRWLLNDGLDSQQQPGPATRSSDESSHRNSPFLTPIDPDMRSSECSEVTNSSSAVSMMSDHGRSMIAAASVSSTEFIASSAVSPTTVPESESSTYHRQPHSSNRAPVHWAWDTGSESYVLAQQPDSHQGRHSNRDSPHLSPVITVEDSNNNQASDVDDIVVVGDRSTSQFIDLDSEGEGPDEPHSTVDVSSTWPSPNNQRGSNDDVQVMEIDNNGNNDNASIEDVELDEEDDEPQYVGQSDVTSNFPQFIQGHPIAFIQGYLHQSLLQVPETGQQLAADFHQLPRSPNPFLQTQRLLNSMTGSPCGMSAKSAAAHPFSPFPVLDQAVTGGEPAVVIDALMSNMCCPICYRSFRRRKKMIEYDRKNKPNVAKMEMKLVETEIADLKQHLTQRELILENMKNESSNDWKKSKNSRKGAKQQLVNPKLKTPYELAENIREESTVKSEGTGHPFLEAHETGASSSSSSNPDNDDSGWRGEVDNGKEKDDVADDEHQTTELRVAKCGHVYCQKCIETHVKLKRSCPVCNQRTQLKQLYPLFL